MIQISLVTPFRDRPDDLSNLMSSLEDTTHYPAQVEVILVIDNCDEATQKIKGKLEVKYSNFNLRIFSVKRSDHFSKDYFNFGAKQASGRWIMAINDDAVFKTPGWDQIIVDKMAESADPYPDDIFFGIVDDGMIVAGPEKLKRTFSCWPLLSKEYCDLMGGILIEEIYTWGGDFWLGQVFNNVLTGKRRVDLREVMIWHNSHHNQLNERPQGKDFTNFQRIENENPAKFNLYDAAVRGEKISEYIRSKR